MANATVGFFFPAGGISDSTTTLRTNNGISGDPAHRATALYTIPWATIYSGWYKITGTATLNGNPVAAHRIFLTPHNIALFVAGACTGSDGVFLFDGLAPGKYTIYGIDQDGTTNGVIWDYVDSVPR